MNRTNYQTLTQGAPLTRLSLIFYERYIYLTILKEINGIEATERFTSLVDIICGYSTTPLFRIAFTFGSWAKGTSGENSDIDIGVYLKDEKKEDKIWVELSRITNREVDLVVFNSALASLISNVLKTGFPLVIKEVDNFENLNPSGISRR
ncbi:nucleotidyltransferase domain-containing protein [Candidatus Aerophobetes bacterium]|nr:nucleotidyltransferase domain-containing protein [Candidatus Aerophobetes bacterium]